MESSPAESGVKCSIHGKGVLRNVGGPIRKSRFKKALPPPPTTIGYSGVPAPPKEWVSRARSDSPYDEDEDEDDDDSEYTDAGEYRPKGPSHELPPVPNPYGRQLMREGAFGASQLKSRNPYSARRNWVLLQREMEPEAKVRRRLTGLIHQTMMPRTRCDTIINLPGRGYSGQFSSDGNFFFCAAQDMWMRLYDTSNPYDWKFYKRVRHNLGQWTITDATLSHDNRHLAYSSICNTVYMVATDPNSSNHPIQFDLSPPDGHDYFGIMSLRFSNDDTEIVAGTNSNAVYVFDLETETTVLHLPEHIQDVNAVCFGDKGSPHLLMSGSDDSLIKVWDRRSLADGRPAGVFVGHTEGITHVEAKQDGRYVLSNGKDQSMKLWDYRRMRDPDADYVRDPTFYMSHFDYRWAHFRDSDYRNHAHDCSVVTYRGHSVHKTLIRCHFAPPDSADSRWVYSASEDGRVHIYNIDATVAGIVDVQEATKNTRPRVGGSSHIRSMFAPRRNYSNQPAPGSWKTCVRDASWHPHAPVMACTAWAGWHHDGGTVSIHTWTEEDVDEDEPQKEVRVEAATAAEEEEELEQQQPGRYNLRNKAASRRRRGSQRRDGWDGYPRDAEYDEEGYEVGRRVDERLVRQEEFYENDDTALARTWQRAARPAPVSLMLVQIG